MNTLPDDLPAPGEPSAEAVPLVGDILRDTAYAMTVFSQEEVDSLEFFLRRGRPYLRCIVTDRDRPARPEEIVRQLYLRKLLHEYGYPRERIAVEKPVYFGSAVHQKAADIVVLDAADPDTAYIIVEVKKPKRTDGIEQLKSYCNAEGSPIGVWTNGGQTAVLHREEPNTFRNLPGIPSASQTLADFLGQRWTIEDLTRANKLVTERMTLKSVILDMENLVLANAGVDAFEEVFKLIYAKLYDEWRAARGRGPEQYLQFRVGGATASEFYDKVDSLFQAAKRQWPGVFLESERVDLTPAHLLTCGSFLEDIKLFNSNLQVIDEAFEYLSLEVGKGKKGQYFTPRHVIDMCVAMLHPRIDEFQVDPAAGSCGFTVHGIFHVWGGDFGAGGPAPWQAEYAREKVYGIDFDPRSVKIAKALNLIAGDGRTNVYRANTLDPRHWPEETRAGMRPRLRRFADPALTRRNEETFRFFDFDVLMTNPPFAGDIKDARILHQYEIARRPDGRWRPSVGRDVLFIERALEFLRPGGRLAIVLPQGRFNNLTDQYIRDFVAAQARLLAVVGLHANTFKPHTPTKTSVLLLQKWNDDPAEGPLCELTVDYPVFFAVSERGGKDNAGNYVYRRGPDGVPELDEHGHLVVDHDLDEIAAAFKAFAAEQRFSFAESA
jgi:type I restriction enzyme M protein